MWPSFNESLAQILHPILEQRKALYRALYRAWCGEFLEFFQFDQFEHGIDFGRARAYALPPERGCIWEEYLRSRTARSATWCSL